MADPRYPVVVIGGVPVVDAPQEIDILNAEFFRKTLLRAAYRGQGTVVVNMAATRFCDSIGVEVLARAHEQAVAADGLDAGVPSKIIFQETRRLERCARASQR